MSDLEDKKAAKADKTGSSKKRSDKAEEKTAAKIVKKAAATPVTKPVKPIQSVNQTLLVIVDQL